MARNVGSVEVVVDADTGKLRAQIVKEAARAGREGAKALSEELGDVDTTEALNEVHKLVVEIERELEGIDALDLDVDSRKVKEELERLKARVAAEVLEFDTEADFTRVNESIAAFREEQERNTIDLSFGVDLQNINRRIEVLRREIEANEIKLNLGADLTSINASIDAFRRKQETDAVDINFGTDMAKINARLAAWRREIEANTINLRLDTDLTKLNASIAAWRQEVEAPRVNIKFRPDLAEMNARIKAFRLIQQNNDVEVPVNPDIDPGEWLAARRAINAWSKGTGKTSGGNFSSGFASSLGDGSTLIIGAIAAMGPALVSGIEGLLSASTAVISSAFSAIVGGGAAATGIVAGFGAAAGAAVVGTRGFSDAVKAINEEFATARAEGGLPNIFSGDTLTALNNLSPQARETAIAFADINTALHDARVEVQDELFTGLAGKLRSFASDTLPSVTGALDIAADSLNTFLGELFDTAADTDFLGTMQALKPALDEAFGAANDFIGAISPFLKTAGGDGGPADKLAGWIHDLAGDFRDFVTNNPQKITDFLDDGVESLRRWFKLLGSVSDLLVTVFSAGKTKGDNFVTSLDTMISRWDTFLESSEGQNKLEDFFNKGKDAIDDFRPVFDGLGDALKILTGDKASEGFSSLMQSLGDSLPAVAEGLTTISLLNFGGTFLDTLSFMRPLLELVNDLDPDILKLAGSMILFSKGIKAVGAAFSEVGLSNAWVLGLSAAMTAVVAIMQRFTSENESQRAGVNELSDAYSTALTNVLDYGDAQSATAAAADVWTEALQGLGSDSKDLEVALGRLNTGMDESKDVFVGLQKGGDAARDTLTGLAESAGLTGEDAQKLADIVNNTNDNFADLGDAGGSMAQASIRFNELSDSSGLSVEQLLETAAAMEEVQDQARKHNLQDVAAQQIALAASGDDATQAMLAQAESITGVDRNAENVVPLLDEMAKLGYEDAQAALAAAEANDALAATHYTVQNAIDDGIAAHQAEVQALKDSRHEAFEAAKEQERFATATRNAAVDLAAADFGMDPDIAQGFVDLGEAFDQTSAAADALSSSLDILFGGFPSFQEATSNAEQALDDMRTQLSGLEDDGEGGQKAVEGWAATLDLGSDAGRENAAAIRESIQAINDQAIAATKNGEATEETIAAYEAQREAIVDSVDALIQQQAAADGTTLSLDASRAQAEAYVNALAGTPEAVETVIRQPGLIDALLNAEDLTLLYDDAGNPVLTEFEALGIDVTTEEAEALRDLILGIDEQDANPTVSVDDQATDPLTTTQDQLTAVDDTVADPTLQLSTYISTIQALGTMVTQLNFIDNMVIDPKITLPTYTDVSTKVITLDGYLTGLPDPIVNISIPGITNDIFQVAELNRQINNLHDRSITITTNTVGSAPGSMAGELIGGPGLRRVGEFGLAEAIVPLELPLSRVDPSVRWMAEMLRGGPGAGRGLTLNQTIVTQTEDTVSVAAQVVNRMSASVAGL